MSETDDLDESLRRTDPDRWLASRFIADPRMRADVVALYGYDNELGRAPRVASNPLLGEIRLTWWREALDEIFEDRRVRSHPVALALARAARERGLERAPLEAMIDARYRELDPSPLARSEARRLAEGAAGAAASLAAQVLGARTEAARFAARDWAALWSLSLLLLAGRVRAEDADLARSAARAGLDEARTAERGLLPVTAFPAVAQATLADAYLRGHRPSELAKRMRLTWAVARGRI